MHTFRTYFSLKGVAATVVLLMSLMLLAAQSAFAQNPFDAKWTVTPQFAPPGVERTLRVDAMWPNGCAPNTASVLGFPRDNPTELNITINVIYTIAACTQAVTPFAVEVKFTPTKVGSMNVNVAMSDLRYVGDWPLVTSSADGVGMLSNLSGTWFERPNPASILTITHKAFDANSSPSARDALVGTWGLFSSAGTARWYVFHTSKRVAPNVLEAELYEFLLAPPVAGGWPSPCPVTACPMVGFTSFSQRIGKVRFEIRSSDQVLVSAIKPTGNGGLIGGVLLFESVMTRFAF
jgi:hypothetical protein